MERNESLKVSFISLPQSLSELVEKRNTCLEMRFELEQLIRDVVRILNAYNKMHLLLDESNLECWKIIDATFVRL